jgi:hydrogenase expression/formation protein HypE
MGVMCSPYFPVDLDAVSAHLRFENCDKDPFEVGNEGKMIIGAISEKAENILKLLRETKSGKKAQIIGETTTDFKGVAMQTSVGGKRIIARPVGDPVPRIC